MFECLHLFFIIILKRQICRQFLCTLLTPILFNIYIALNFMLSHNCVIYLIKYSENCSMLPCISINDLSRNSFSLPIIHYLCCVCMLTSEHNARFSLLKKRTDFLCLHYVFKYIDQPRFIH